MIRSKKVIVTILSLILSTSIFIGCGKKENTEDSNKTENIKEITSPEGLQKEEPWIEFLAYGTSIEKTPEEFNNYKTIKDFIEGFNKAESEVDYTKEETYYDMKNYLSDFLIQKLGDYSENTKKIKDNKLQIDYVKTNIDKIIYSNYSDSYYVECTVYTFVKNDPDIPIQNRYYQKKSYIYVTKENEKLVMASAITISRLPAEQIYTKPTYYRLDTGTEDNITGVYLTEQEVDKLPELDSVKSKTEEYFKNYYTANANDMNGFDTKILNLTTSKGKEDIKNTVSNRINDIVSNKYELEFKGLVYDELYYSEFDSTYYVTTRVFYDIKNKEGIEIPYCISLKKENSEWKIDGQMTGGENFIVKQNK